MRRVPHKFPPEVKNWLQEFITHLAMRDRFATFLSATLFWVRLDRYLRNAAQRIACRDAKKGKKPSDKAETAAKEGGE